MKKGFAILLALMLLLGSASALAEYDKHIDFSATYVDRGSTQIDAMYDFFCDQFNVDIEMIPIAWSALPDTNSVMIMGGTMYDWMMITWDYNTFLSYVDQGLIKALPEDFEEKYPNIARAFDASGVGEYLYVDGVAYGTPMPIYFNFSDYDYALSMMTCYYRADWAKELGFEWDESVTITEFEAYLKACIERDMAGNGQTLGLTTAGGNVASIYVSMFNEAYGTFRKVDGQYVWGPTMEGTVEGIQKAKAAYDAGLIDPDFYALDGFEAQNKLAAGLAAACFNTGTAANYRIILDSATAAGIENAEEVIKPIVLTDDEGVWHGPEVKNFWCINVFRPDLDEETYERMLDMIDYLYTVEAEEVVNMGIKGVDWEVDADGYYVSHLEEQYSNIRQKYPSGWFWRDTTICLDEFDLVNPTYSKSIIDIINAVYAYRYDSAQKHGYLEMDYHVDYLSTESMRNYSVAIPDEITRIVCDSDIKAENIQAEWDAFIKTYEGMWKPVVDDLNSTME